MGKTTGVAMLVAALAAGGCIGELGSEPAEESSLRAYLAGQGYDPRHVRFEGERVFVEQDAFVERSDLLAEMAVATDRTTPETLVEKGYWRGGEVPYAKRIGLTFDDNVPEWLRNAVAAAGVEWSQSSSCVKISKYFTEPGTHFVRVTYRLLPNGYSAQAQTGSGACPPDVTPQQVRACAVAGRLLEISSGVWPGTPDRTPERYRTYDDALAMAVHEVGHILGFKHPFVTEGNKVHITGTGWVNPACDGNGEGCKVSYQTVMDYNENRERHLTADDRKSLQRIYHPSRPSCQLP
jgi:hypothetical protein